MQFFCFLQEQQQGKGIHKITFFFLCVCCYTGLYLIHVRAYEEHIPGYFLHTGWTVQRVQSKLKRIVLACETSLESPNWGKDEMIWGIQRETSKSAIRTTVVWEQVTTNRPLLEKKNELHVRILPSLGRQMQHNHVM